MPCPQLTGSLRRVKWVGEQQELIDETWFRRGQYRRLPPSVRMATQKYAARSLSSHGSNCRTESILVTFSTSALWWPVRSQLAEGEIAAEDGQPGVAECSCQRDQKWRVAVCSSAVRQDEAIPIRIGRAVQKAANWHFILRSVAKFSIAVHAHVDCSQWLQPCPNILAQSDRRKSMISCCSRVLSLLKCSMTLFASLPRLL